MLPDWQLGVVLSESDSQARLGWLQPAPGVSQPPVPQTGMLSLADVAWARPVKDGKPGPAPHKMADVVQPGDVVMVQPLEFRLLPADAASGTPIRAWLAPDSAGPGCARVA